MQSLFLKFYAPPKGPDETCYLNRSHMNLLLSTHSNKQMICWVPSTGLLSLKKQTTKYEFSISNCPTTQGKRSQLNMVGCIHSLSMLLVWKRSETSHHLGDECQNFLQHWRIVSHFLTISSASAATTIIT